MAHSDSLVAWLANPANHPDNPEHVEVHETHISWVFVTRQFAYKLKKPVRFPFLDFSELKQRQKACEEEVYLNRRLATDVYLGTVPVTRSPEGAYALGGDSEPIDWLVKMRRLDAERRCDVLLERDALREEQLLELADALAHFYRHAPANVLKPSHFVTRQEINILGNRTDLLRNIQESAQAIVKRVHAGQLQFLRLFGDVFHDRVCAGRVVDGHGDLRPEHVYLYSPPKIVDCIEFNPSYRIVDVCDDLSFFAMECTAMGRREEGQRLMDECLTALGDAPRDELVRFYVSYRACVRAKVALCSPARTRLDQAGATEKALRYLHLADASSPLEGPPFLLVVCGGVGTGKSTLARRLAIDLGFDHVQTDLVRREMFGDAGRSAGLDEGIYRPDNRLRVYREVFQQALRLLDKRVPVVIDGSFQLAGVWQELERLLPHTRARVLVVYCRCAPELARSRIEKRLAAATSESDARPEMVRDAGDVVIEIPENLSRVSVDTANPPSVLAECVLRRMRAMVGG